MEIKRLTAQHAAAAAQAERACFSAPWSEQQLCAHLQRADHTFIGAFMDGALIGYGGYYIAAGEGYVLNIAVLSEHRARGVGSAILAALIEDARTRGAGFLTLELRRSNEAARALYSKHGFVSAGVRRGFYRAPAEDAEIMTLILEEEHEQC